MLINHKKEWHSFCGKQIYLIYNLPICRYICAKYFTSTMYNTGYIKLFKQTVLVAFKQLRI